MVVINCASNSKFTKFERRIWGVTYFEYSNDKTNLIHALPYGQSNIWFKFCLPVVGPMPAESDGIDDAVEGGQSGTSWKRIYYTMDWEFNVTK